VSLFVLVNGSVSRQLLIRYASVEYIEDILRTLFYIGDEYMLENYGDYRKNALLASIIACPNAAIR
jgi:hypothetical protein